MSIKPGTGRKSDKTMGKIQLPVEHEISLWLDTYEDIFSDFDPRPLGQRALSDDFLSEAKRAIRERKEGSFELHLLIPTTQRSSATEAVVRKRLREHFTKHATRLAGERKSPASGSSRSPPPCLKARASSDAS